MERRIVARAWCGLTSGRGAKPGDSLFWNGERIAREDAVVRFAEAGRRRPQPEIYLRADQNVAYRHVAEMLADASRAGAEQDRVGQRAGTLTSPRGRARLPGRESFGAAMWSSFLCRSM